MYFEQFYLNCLAHASYMIGSEGVAAVVDPQRDVQIYLDAAARLGLRIAHVIETHMHADFVSGHRELAARTGAEIWVSYRSGARFPHRSVRDNDELRFGRCRLRFLETPGHSLDSLCVLLFDEDSPDGAAKPYAVLTGDTLFIGDVGRPDLSSTHTPQELAGLLFDSLHQKLLTLPDDTLVYPAHGAGSLCGRVIGEGRHSTIGQERTFNYALQPRSRQEFVELLTAEFAERPDYFARDVEINRTGAVPLTDLPPIPPLTPQQVLHKQAAGAIVLDTRTALEFGAGHVPGSIHIALSGQFASWAGTLIGLDHPMILVAEPPEQLQEARMRLARVGMENVIGYLAGAGGESSAPGILAWQQAGLELREVPQISTLELYRALCNMPEDFQVIDVRRPAEWEAGHLERATLKPLNKLRTLLDDLDTRRTLAVHCKSGYRSSIATSLLLRAGFKNVVNVVGGFDAWLAQRLPVVSEKSVASGCAT